MALPIKPNGKIKYLQCIRCGETYPVDDYFEGCPKCRDEGKPANLTFVYAEYGKECPLPYDSYFSLGEGNTPLLPVFDEFPPFYLKYEGRNPSGSHKDRMSAMIVTRAAEKGYEGVAVATSGNAGLSLASYCAYFGLKCAVIATKDLNPQVRRFLEAFGAEIHLTDTPMERWEILKRKKEEGFYPGSNYSNPPVGTVHFGVQGYKAVAYEIVGQLKGTVPDKVLVPASRGDLLWGVWLGFKEMKQADPSLALPAMIACEPFARLSRVLDGEDYTRSFPGETALKSIDGTTVTYQAVKALRESNGFAVEISNEEAEAARKELAKRGILLELSSAASYGAYKKLRKDGAVGEKEVVVAIGTSSGFVEI